MDCVPGLVLLGPPGTIGSQLWRQWRKQTSEGVSVWLFVGQAAASSGLLVYSALGDQLVLVVLNAIMVLAALVGLMVWFHCRRIDLRARSSTHHA